MTKGAFREYAIQPHGIFVDGIWFQSKELYNIRRRQGPSATVEARVDDVSINRVSINHVWIKDPFSPTEFTVRRADYPADAQLDHDLAA